MKKSFTLLFLMVIGFSMNAQERYLDEVFDNVTVMENVVYGVNGTVLFLPNVGEVVPIPLTMDVYMPEGDTETNRPLVLVFHTGNFLPQGFNLQIAGGKQDSSAVEFCTQLAKRGFVAASVDYRTGWNPTAQTQPERALGLIQAAYRGLQDGRNAVRYFRADALGANAYGVDESRITIFGLGTGGYLVLGMTGLSDYNEIITTTNSPGKFLLDTDADGVPDTPMVIEPFHGDINGEVLTVTPPDGSSVPFGLPPGDTTNYSNIAGVSSDFALTVNVGGALGDISWLSDNTTPIISIQDPFDIFAPYDDAVLIVPTTGDPIVQVQGAQQIGAFQEASGNNQIWKNAVFDDAITQTAIANSAIAGHPYYEGTFPFVRPLNSAGIPEGVVINWWSQDDPSHLGNTWGTEPHPLGGSYHDQGLILNEGMSAEKSRANIADVMAYVLPRACVALDLPCAANFLSSTEDLLENVEVKISPNPMGSVALVETGDMIMQEIRIYDVKGAMVQSHRQIERNFFEIQNTNLQTGIYSVQIRFEEGVTTTQLVVE